MLTTVLCCAGAIPISSHQPDSALLSFSSTAHPGSAQKCFLLCVCSPIGSELYLCEFSEPWGVTPEHMIRCFLSPQFSCFYFSATGHSAPCSWSIDGATVLVTEQTGGAAVTEGGVLFSRCLFSFPRTGKNVECRNITQAKRKGHAIGAEDFQLGLGVRKRWSSCAAEAMISQSFAAAAYKIHMYLLGNSLHMSCFLLHTKHQNGVLNGVFLGQKHQGGVCVFFSLKDRKLFFHC